MYYNTCILHLFRPIIRFDLVNSSVNPGTTCMGAAIEISRIMDRYRAVYVKYGMRTVNILMTYALISAATVHLFDVPSKSLPRAEYTEANSRAYLNFWQILQDLTEMSSNHIYAARGIKILRGLAEKNGRVVPEGRQDPARPFPSTETVKPHESSDYTSSAMAIRSSAPENGLQVPDIGPQDHDSGALQTYNGQGSVFSNSGGVPPAMRHTLSYPTAPSGPSRTHSSPQIPSVPSVAYAPVAMSNGSADAPVTSPHAENNSREGQPPSIFWTPFEGHQLPLYSQNHNMSTSPMDISNMLGRVDVWEQFNRDGFKVSDAWAQDPLIGVNEHTDGELLGGLPQQHPHMGDSNGQAESAASAELQPSVADREIRQGYQQQQQQWWSR
jgi:hypothetical protein